MHLTRMNQFELQEAIPESLAGRTAVFNMGALSFSEIYKYDYTGPFNHDLDGVTVCLLVCIIQSIIEISRLQKWIENCNKNSKKRLEKCNICH